MLWRSKLNRRIAQLAEELKTDFGFKI